MKKTRKAINYALCIMNCALALACSSDENGGDAAKYITVSPTIGTMTRTTTNSDGDQVFAQNDQISVYAWTGSATSVNASGMVVNNAINTYDGSSAWTASPQMLWKDMTTAHYFLSVYPSRTISDFTADPYTLDVSKQEASDLLVAINTGTSGAGLTATSNAVPLEFNHAMAKLIVNLTFRNQWNDGNSSSPVTPTVESVTATAKSAATVNYVSESGTVVTASGDQGAIVLPATTANTCYTSIMVPQAGFQKIAIKIDGKDYTFTHTADIPLESGKYTTVNLIVGRNQIDLGTVSINGWGEGGSISGGEAQTD